MSSTEGETNNHRAFPRMTFNECIPLGDIGQSWTAIVFQITLLAFIGGAEQIYLSAV